MDQLCLPMDLEEDKVLEKVLLLDEESYIKLEHYFVDGTKIDANANRYTFVWGKGL
jgi:transposase